MQFSAPSSSATLTPAEVEGHVLVIEPVEYVASIVTAYGDTDAIRVTVHDITEQTTTEEVLWFSGVLVGSLKARIGQKVLAVMGKGTAKAGQSAPWVLNDASGVPQAVDAATAYLTKSTAATLTAPAPVAQDDLAAAIGNLKLAGM